MNIRILYCRLSKDKKARCVKNVTLPQVFFKHFGSKNQLPGLSIIGTLVENELKRPNLVVFFLNLDFICLRVPEHIRTNKHISYKTNSTWWNLKSTKSHCGISRKSVVMYNIYSPEGNYFRREEGKFLFWGENSPNSIK